jgi:hypothetical protein
MFQTKPVEEIKTHSLYPVTFFPKFVAFFGHNIKIYVKKWAGHVARMGEGRGVYRVLVGKPEGKRPLGRPRRRWEDGSSGSGMWGFGLDGASSG